MCAQNSFIAELEDTIKSGSQESALKHAGASLIFFKRC